MDVVQHCPTIKTNGCSIFVNWILHPFNYLFGHIHLGLFYQICVQSMVWWMFIVGSRSIGCFHNFYEHQVLHNIEGMFASKKSCHFLSKSCFLVEFNPSSNETCQKVQVWLFVDLLEPFVLFVKGWKFKPLPPKTLKENFLPLKDLVFQWPCPMFTHPRYGLVLPCHLVVEGQVHHIGQIRPSPLDVLLNTLQL
jgi:hypothetical protein